MKTALLTVCRKFLSKQREVPLSDVIETCILPLGSTFVLATYVAVGNHFTLISSSIFAGVKGASGLPSVPVAQFAFEAVYWSSFVRMLSWGVFLSIFPRFFTTLLDAPSGQDPTGVLKRFYMETFIILVLLSGLFLSLHLVFVWALDPNGRIRLIRDISEAFSGPWSDSFREVLSVSPRKWRYWWSALPSVIVTACVVVVSLSHGFRLRWWHCVVVIMAGPLLLCPKWLFVYEMSLLLGDIQSNRYVVILDMVSPWLLLMPLATRLIVCRKRKKRFAH